MRILITLLCIIAFPAFAQEKLDTPKYSPDYCQFTATFPTEPYITQKCEDPAKEDTCFNLISYTQVFEMSATISVEIICNPSTPEMYEQFTPEVMEKTVRAMTEGSVVEAYEMSTKQRETYRHTGLVGKGRKGLDDTLLISQLWIADKSIMSVKAEISGRQRDDADKMFADILQTIGFSKEMVTQDKK